MVRVVVCLVDAGELGGWVWMRFCCWRAGELEIGLGGETGGAMIVCCSFRPLSRPSRCGFLTLCGTAL